MAERSVTSSSLRAALAWLATFALAHRLLGGPRWLVAFAIASIVVAALGWRGLLRPLGALSGLVVAVAVPTAGAVVVLLLGFQLLPDELPGVLAHERSAVLDVSETPMQRLHHAATAVPGRGAETAVRSR